MLSQKQTEKAKGLGAQVVESLPEALSSIPTTTQKN
jgi:hypothetical protein